MTYAFTLVITLAALVVVDIWLTNKIVKEGEVEEPRCALDHGAAGQAMVAD